MSISPVLQGEVGYLLQRYLSHKKINRDNLSRTGFSKSSSNDSFVTDGGQIEEDIPTSPNNAVEKLLFRKSEKLLNQQRYWQVLFYINASLNVFYLESGVGLLHSA